MERNDVLTRDSFPDIGVTQSAISALFAHLMLMGDLLAYSGSAINTFVNYRLVKAAVSPSLCASKLQFLLDRRF
jgi:hypothetical protein